MNVVVIVYPGSNADWDALHVLRDVLHANARYVFHKETTLGEVDAVVIPGGFAHGDYLRAGAIARFSPISNAVREFSEKGGPVLGICNGFQVLTEMHLLPGALTRNRNLRFECRDVFVRTEGQGVFSHTLQKAEVLRLPVAHADGRYQCDESTLAQLEKNNQVAFRYCTFEGSIETSDAVNINGSVSNIAGVYNEKRNVLGLMPHPERASEAILGNADGLKLFYALREHVRAPQKVA